MTGAARERPDPAQAVGITRRRAATLLLIVAGLFMGAIILVAAGLLDRFAQDGHVERRAAIGCLLAYWLVTSLAVAALTYASTRWRELLLSLGATVLVLGLAEGLLRLMAVPRRSRATRASARS